MKSNGIDVKKACERMCRVFGYQIFQSGFVHADPHPGNLFVRKNPNGKGDIQLVILDHGLYQRVEPHVQVNNESILGLSNSRNQSCDSSIFRKM